jgi:UPF0716 protein FxsA
MRFLTVFALLSLAEMFTFFWVQSWIGLGWALGLAVATALIGSYLVRRAGISVLGRLRRKVGQGQVPGRELSDGAAILVSGAFLISPGFITDFLGFLLLVPAVRRVVYAYVSRRFLGNLTVFTAGGGTVTRGRPVGDGAEEIIDVDGWE